MARLLDTICRWMVELFSQMQKAATKEVCSNFDTVAFSSFEIRELDAYAITRLRSWRNCFCACERFGGKVAILAAYGFAVSP